MKNLSDFLFAFNQGASVHTQNNQGQTALHLAVLEQNQAEIERLIKLGLSIYTKDKNQFSPLHLAKTISKELANNLMVWNGLMQDDKTAIVFKVDLEKKRIFDPKINPADVTTREVGWLFAANNRKFKTTEGEKSKTGKWMLFPPRKVVNNVWNKIKEGIADGDLWSAKVLPVSEGQNIHPIMVYTHNYEDIQDVVRVLDYLESKKIKLQNRAITYKTNEATRAGSYGQKTWLYKSDTVRSLLNPDKSHPQRTAHFFSPALRGSTEQQSTGLFTHNAHQ